MGPQLRMALEHQLPRFVMPSSGPWDFGAEFPDCQRFVLEIGSGMGEATLDMARKQHHTGLVAVEVHDRGVAALARRTAELDVSNVRIHVGDAVAALNDLVGPASLDEVRVWFPDPWPKSRHHKRRLITAEFLDLVISRLNPTGRVHLATDHADYAEVMAGLLAAESRLSPEIVDSPRPDWRPITKFERAGLAAGRPSHDFVYARTGITVATEPLRL